MTPAPVDCGSVSAETCAQLEVVVIHLLCCHAEPS